MSTNYLEELNESQREAVTAIEGPIMIIAGAGSGKTRVLTYRIAHLLELGVDPFNILSLTFTNKAAKEMRHRVEKMVGSEARNLWMGTFHSIFSRILRVEADKLGYPSTFTIYDSDDSKSVIKSILKLGSVSDESYKPGQVLSRISLAKNNFISPQQYINDPTIQEEDIRAGKPRIGEIYNAYMIACKKAGAMDFDDLLLNTYKLFVEHPNTLNKYQQKFKFCMVDEYQDTNHIQYLIIKKLVAVTRNICVVGDDAQSIYAFRGANIKNILNFEKDYPDLKIFKLEQNYRSTGNIVHAASDIIKKNKHQLEKNIWTSNEIGHKIKVFKALSDNEEGMQVANSIFEEKMENQASHAQFAILYRTNSQSRAFEESLRRLNLPYRIIGGLSFYQRKEVKDLLSYFRLALNPDDDEAFKRVINYPARGIGDTTLNKLIALANQQDTSIWRIASNIVEMPFDTRVKRAVYEFTMLINRFHSDITTKDAYELAFEMAKSSRILAALGEDKSIEGMGRYENIQELLGAIKEFSERTDIEEKHLGVFMMDVVLLTDADKQDDKEDKVTMMTIHGSKGLEFDYVYVGGLEENLFPSQMALTNREDLEEERRLFYVALTRARKRAFLSYASTRFRWGNIVHSEPSRFIDEINPIYLDYQLKNSRDASAPESNLYTSPRPLKPVNANLRAAPAHDFQPDDVSGLVPGVVIEHNRFGKGKVISIEGNDEQRKANIFFQEAGQKQILLKYAKIKILG